MRCRVGPGDAELRKRPMPRKAPSYHCCGGGGGAGGVGGGGGLWD